MFHNQFHIQFHNPRFQISQFHFQRVSHCDFFVVAAKSDERLAIEIERMKKLEAEQGCAECGTVIFHFPVWVIADS